MEDQKKGQGGHWVVCKGLGADGSKDGRSQIRQGSGPRVPNGGHRRVVNQEVTSLTFKKKESLPFVTL